MRLSDAHPPDGPAPTQQAEGSLPELRRALTTRPAKVILTLTLLLGLLAAAALVASLPPADRTLAAVSTPVQSMMSVTAPFLGVLLTSPLRHTQDPTTVRPKLLAAVRLAVVIALFGLAVSAIAIVAASSAASPGTWHNSGAVVLGCIIVQIIAQLVGTGLGMLIRRPVVAGIATIVLPLGVWAILGATEATSPAQDWLTPFAGVGRLTAGAMTAVNWVQSLVVFLIWAVGLNALGAARLPRR